MQNELSNPKRWALRLIATSFRDGRQDDIIQLVTPVGDIFNAMAVARDLGVADVDDVDSVVEIEEYAKQEVVLITKAVTNLLTVEEVDKALAGSHERDYSDTEMDIFLQAIAVELEDGADAVVTLKLFCQLPEEFYE